jgi:hypothetical protein
VSDNSTHRLGFEDLVAQDTKVASFHFEDFRMNLEQSVERLEQRARFVRRASQWGLGVLIFCVLAVIPLQLFGLGQPGKYEWILPVWSACGLVAMLATGVLSGVYSYRYRPALKRARSEMQLSTIDNLQQQISELKERLDG